MSRNPFKRLSNLPPHVALVSAIIGVIALASAALLFSETEPGVKANLVPRAARVERVEGNVGVARAFDKESASQVEWAEASVNTPVSVGDRVYAHPGSRASLAFTGRNYARLDPGASLDILSLADSRTQLALRDGSAIFDLGHLDDGELFEVATPHGAVDFYEPGLYQVGIDDSGSTMISVLSGLAQVVGLAGSGQISKGEILTLVGQTAAQVLMSRLAPDLAGSLVDDYYGYRYPNSYDGRYRSYDRYLDDPYYYDPYRRSPSYNHLSSYDVPGLYDLDNYGDWVDVSDHGRCWSPRVNQDWAPYQSGNWVIDDVWGPTWVSQEPWGWAPYHYGRWAYVNNRQWVWVPDRATSRPIYSPALVAFVPLRQTNQIAWVPLAPGEPYVPRYYDASFQPQYLAAPELVNQVINNHHYQYANLNVARAVAVVPVREFTEVIEPDLLYPVNQQLLAQSQPVLDPYAVDDLRQMAMRADDSRPRIKVPRAVQQEVFNTPVITSMPPLLPPDRAEMLRALQVSSVPEKQKKQKMKMDDSGQVTVARRADGLPQSPFTQQNASVASEQRKQRIAQLATQAAQGDKAARNEMRELKRQQRKDEKLGRHATGEQAQWQQQVKSQPKAQQQQGAIIDQAREQKKAQRQLERQQRAAFAQQQNQREVRQAETQKQVKQQQRVAQPDAPHRWVDDLKRGEQRKAQRQAERQQRATEKQQQHYANQQTAVQQQAREQRKAQRQAERQQYMMRQQQQQQVVEQQRKQPVFIQPVDKNREQRKAERRAVREQAAWQQQARPQQQQQQVKPQQQAPQQSVQQGGQGQAGGGKAQRKAERAERKAGRGKP